MARFGSSVSVLVIVGIFFLGKAQADILADANEVLLDAIKVESFTPPVAVRALVIFHQASASAISDMSQGAVSDDEKRVRALGALLEVGETEFVDSRSTIREWAGQAVPRSVSPGERLRALKLGRESARALLANRRNDLAIAKLPDFVPAEANAPGFPVWAPPAGTTALHPRWGLVTPIVLNQDDMPLLPSPATLDSDAFQSDLFETFLYGGYHSHVRSESERTTAIFWAQNKGSVTPPGQWNAIAQSFSARTKLSLKTEATLFSILNIALFDASIACWMNKYHYRHPRPDAAITELIDMDWRPVLTTPPHPEYPSGHSTFSAAAATVLEAFNRGRLKQIEVVSEDVPDEVRRFSSFFEAAAEAGRSRIFGGIHFEESNAAGQMLGREVALRVLSSHFVEE